jgi:putative DNA methylase
LSLNWWVYKRPEKINHSRWCAVEPIPNVEKKRVDFGFITGTKGKGTTIDTGGRSYDPAATATISRSTGKCPNCGNVIQDSFIKKIASESGLKHQVYAVAYQKGEGVIEFRLPDKYDVEGIRKAQDYISKNFTDLERENLIPDVEIPYSHMVHERNSTAEFGLTHWHKFFNERQLLTLVTYVSIIRDAGKLMVEQYDDLDKAKAILSYLSLILDRCADMNSRLSGWKSSVGVVDRASAQHALNLVWNYGETNGAKRLWGWCAETVADDYSKLCFLIGMDSSTLFQDSIEKHVRINSVSADDLSAIPSKSVDVIVTDPPYYGTIQYAEMADFFYVWQKSSFRVNFP